MFSLACTLLLGSVPSLAATVAYWRFENGIADTELIHNSDTNGAWSSDVPDSSGNGNDLSVWMTGGGGGMVYKSDVASATIPQTGATNTLSVKNSGGGPAMWNQSLRTWTPATWTVEAVFKPENGGYRTLVGRDSRGAGTQPGVNASDAAMYFQLRPNNVAAILFQDVSGYEYLAQSSANAFQGFNYSSDPDGLTGKWYAMAAVSDGKTLSLYLNDIAAGTGYQQVAQTNIAAQGSTNTALTAGTGSGGDWTAGDFSVGRGLYNGSHVDRAYGFIDEVRLSDTALTPNQFLYAVPSEVEVRGTVTDSFTGAPVAGATVKIGARTTLTDNAGKYSLFTTPGSTFPITVSSTYAETEFASTVTTPVAGFVTKDATLPIRPHISLNSASGFSWKVLGNTGGSADFSAISADETGFQAITVPGDWDGVVGGTADIYGWYRLHFTVPSNFTTTIPGRLIRFHLGPDAAIDDIDATYLNGHLIGATGRFPSVALPVQPAGHTNPTAEGLPETRYAGMDLAYDAERSYYFPASYLLPGQDNVIAIKVFDLGYAGGLIGTPILEVATPTGTVIGSVKVGGAGVAGVRVSGMDANGISSDYTFTDGSGNFTLTHVNAGPSVIGMAKPGLMPQAAEVTVSAGASIAVNFTTTSVAGGGPAPIYDEFENGPDGWMTKWTAIALEPNLPENAPAVYEPGYLLPDMTIELPGTVTVQNITGVRGGILSKDRISRYASVNSGKIVSSLTQIPEPTGTEPNVIFRLMGDSQEDPALLNTGSRFYEVVIEGYATFNDGNGNTDQRVGLKTFSQAQWQSSVTAMPFPLARMGDVTPENPLTVTIVRTGSVYDTYVTNHPDGVTNSVLVHSDNIPDAEMVDHRIFPYMYHDTGMSTWDWVRAVGATPVQPPVPLAVRALRVAGGLTAAPTPSTGAPFTELNASNTGASSGRIDVLDAVALAKQGL